MQTRLLLSVGPSGSQAALRSEQVVGRERENTQREARC